jgi:hypothetical protein
MDDGATIGYSSATPDFALTEKRNCHRRPALAPALAPALPQ